MSINDKKSSCLPVTSGVPQGSVLGPTLFIYYINDLPDNTNIPTKIFADDTRSWNKVLSLQDQIAIQFCIDNLDKWSIDWLLFFNKIKCGVLHLGKDIPSF